MHLKCLPITNSLLVVGAELGISKKALDPKTDLEKSLFNLDDGEYGLMQYMAGATYTNHTQKFYYKIDFI